MKKFIVSLLILILLFSGCENKTVSDGSNSEIEIVFSDFQMPEENTVLATLYYPSEDYTQLLAFPQEFEQSGSVTEIIIDALLHGTSKGYISPFPNNTECRNITLTQNILYVDLSAEFSSSTISAERFYGCIASLVYSFCELSQVDYVNITVEGNQLLSPETKRPIMLLSKRNCNISDLMTKYSSSGTIESFYACLYEYDTSKHYLIPTVKNITVSDKNYSGAIINSLLNFDSENRIFPKGFSVNTMPALEQNAVNLILVCPKNWTYDSSWLGFECCACALSFLYPTATKFNMIIVDHNNYTIFSKKDNISNCYGLIRSAVDIVAPVGNRLGKSVLLVSRLSVRDDLKNFTTQYLETVSPVFAEKASVVNDVILSGNSVIIDLSSEFFDYYSSQNLTVQEEYAVIYSLISTVCAYSSATKAIILQNNRCRSVFCNKIVLSEPLITLPDSFIDSLT